LRVVPFGSPSSSSQKMSSPSQIFPSAEFYLPATSETLQYTFSANHTPQLYVPPGSKIHVETIDCYSGRIRSQKDANLHMEAEECNPVTGPIFVQGAEVGDILAVTLHDIRPNQQGVARCCVEEGQLGHTINIESNSYYAVFFDVVDGFCTMQHRRDVSFPTSPMLGVIGVAPESPERTMPAGYWGGNLDNNNNGIGSTIYIQVRTPGALLSIGDMHASMGDGEICGTGVEIGGDVLLTTDIIKKCDINVVMPTVSEEEREKLINELFHYPVTETRTHWICHAVTNQDISLAMTKACEAASLILQTQWGFTPEDGRFII